MRIVRAAIILSLLLVFASFVFLSMNVGASPTHGGGGGGTPGKGEKTNPQTTVVQEQVIVVVEVVSRVTNVNPVVQYAVVVVTATSQAPVASEAGTSSDAGLIGLAVSGIGMASVAVILTVLGAGGTGLLYKDGEDGVMRRRLPGDDGGGLLSLAALVSGTAGATGGVGEIPPDQDTGPDRDDGDGHIGGGSDGIQSMAALISGAVAGSIYGGNRRLVEAYEFYPRPNAPGILSETATAGGDGGISSMFGLAGAGVGSALGGILGYAGGDGSDFGGLFSEIGAGYELGTLGSIGVGGETGFGDLNGSLGIGEFSIDDGGELGDLGGTLSPGDLGGSLGDLGGVLGDLGGALGDLGGALGSLGGTLGEIGGVLGSIGDVWYF